MTIHFDSAVSIASLYLALVGLLSAFFFVQLGQWLNAILATEAKWLKVSGLSNDQYFDKKLECYYEAVQSSSSWTFVGWLAITVFLAVLFVFLEVLRSHLEANDAGFIWIYVNIPCYIFLGLYLGLSLVMLWVGYEKSKHTLSAATKEL